MTTPKDNTDFGSGKSRVVVPGKAIAFRPRKPVAVMLTRAIRKTRKPYAHIINFALFQGLTDQGYAKRREMEGGDAA